MKSTINCYNKKLKAGLLLSALYIVYLVAFHSLLSNPYDYLSTHSFADYKTKPDKCSDCLLLLGKQQAVKHQNGTNALSVAEPAVDSGYFANVYITESVFKLPAFNSPVFRSKLYRLLCVFLI